MFSESNELKSESTSSSGGMDELTEKNREETAQTSQETGKGKQTVRSGKANGCGTLKEKT